MPPQVIHEFGNKVQEEHRGQCSSRGEFLCSDAIQTANKDISVNLFLKEMFMHYSFHSSTTPLFLKSLSQCGSENTALLGFLGQIFK